MEMSSRLRGQGNEKVSAWPVYVFFGVPFTVLFVLAVLGGDFLVTPEEIKQLRDAFRKAKDRPEMP